MKDYKSDGNLNYADLSSGDIGTPKVYGPCSSCSGSNKNLTFKLEILLKNCIGAELGMVVYNTDKARSEANKIVAETGHWGDRFLSCFSQENRRKLSNRIYEKVNYHKRGNSVDTSVCNEDYNPFDDENYVAFLESMDQHKGY